MATMPRVGSTSWSLRRLQGCRHGFDNQSAMMAVNEMLAAVILARSSAATQPPTRGGRRTLGSGGRNGQSRR